VQDVLESEYKDVNKLNFTEFQQKVRQRIKPLHAEFSDAFSTYGTDRLGYIKGTVEGGNKTIVWHNVPDFGKGIYKLAHKDLPEKTLGHTRYFIDKELPNTFYILENQSDLFQSKVWRDNGGGTEDRLRKEFEATRRTAQNKLDIAKETEPDFWDRILGLSHVEENNALFDIASVEKDLKELDSKAVVKRNTTPELNAVGDFYLERQLQEAVNVAAQMGMHKVRIPTSKTVYKIQDYDKLRMLRPDKLEKMQPILRRYDEMPKTVKRLFDVKVTPVTDRLGNEWYEFDIPESYLKNQAEIVAFKQGGITHHDKVHI
jgi:hypothetical protein